MSLRAISTLGIAALLGLVSVWLARSWLQAQVSEQGAPTEQMRQVVVAATGLDFGSRLGREHLRAVTWPVASIPPGSFTSIDDLVGSGQERIVLRAIEENEPILASKVTAPGGRAALSTVLPTDKRAITIRVNDVLGVAGFVLPGDRVDVLLTRAHSDNNPASESVTNLLLQNLRVLGIDQEASERKEKPTVAKAVTLEVSPDEAQMLTLGSQVGSLSLALRNSSDQAAVQARPVTLADLEHGANKVEGAPAKRSGKPRSVNAAASSIRVIRGIDAEITPVQAERDPLLVN